MRQIQPQSTTMVSTQRQGGAHRSLPSTGVYIPNYSGINQVLYNPGGGGRVQFMNALASMGQSYMSEQQALYDKMEVAKYVGDADLKYKQEGANYLQNNPTGKGYTDYITNKYDEITQNALSQASNANVKAGLQMVFASRKADIANNAFQKEKEIYTGYATAQTTNQLSAISNEVMMNPGEVASLSQKYSQQMSAMEHVLSGLEYEKYKTKQMQEFMFSYGIGLINKDPYSAQELVKGSEFAQQLDAEKFNKLQKLARGEADYRTRKAREYDRMVKMEQLMSQTAVCNDLYGKMILGNCSEADIISADIPNSKRLELLSKLRTVNREQLKSADAQTQIAHAILNRGYSVTHIPDNEIEKFALDYFDKQKTENNRPMTLVEKAQYLTTNKHVFKNALVPFENEVYFNLKNETDPNKIMDACVVVQSASSCPAMKNIKKDKDAQDFATYVYNLYKGSRDLNTIKIAREEWFKTTPEMRKTNDEKWHEITRVTTLKNGKRELLSEFYTDNGYNEVSWIRFLTPNGLSGNDRQKIDDNVFNILHRVFKQSGNMVTANTVAKSWMNQHVVKDPVTGKFSYDPPSIGNTKFNEIKELQQAIKDRKLLALYHAVNKQKDWSIKNMYLEKVGDDNPVYRFYVLDNPDDPNARTYLMDRTLTSITADLDKDLTSKQEEILKEIKKKWRNWMH